MKIILFIIWFLIFMFLLNLGLELISNPNYIDNYVGVFIIMFNILISYKTKCLTILTKN